MVKCSNGHEIANEFPATSAEARQPCSRCGTKDREHSVTLKEESKALNDPYNTVVNDSAQGRKIEESCRLYFQRKFASRNPGNMRYEEILKKIQQEFSSEQFADLEDIGTVTGNLAHGNGFGAMCQFKEICVRKGYVLLSNDIVKGSGINSLKDIENLAERRHSGECAPMKITKDSDMFEGNLVWTRTCRDNYLKLCIEINNLVGDKIQGLI